MPGGSGTGFSLFIRHSWTRPLYLSSLLHLVHVTHHTRSSELVKLITPKTPSAFGPNYLPLCSSVQPEHIAELPQTRISDVRFFVQTETGTGHIWLWFTWSFIHISVSYFSPFLLVFLFCVFCLCIVVYVFCVYTAVWMYLFLPVLGQVMFANDNWFSNIFTWLNEGQIK